MKAIVLPELSYDFSRMNFFICYLQRYENRYYFYKVIVVCGGLLQGVPCLLPEDSWDGLEHARHPREVKRIRRCMDGWMESFVLFPRLKS